MTQLRAVKAWYDSRLGMVTLEDDVLSIVRQVRELYGDKVTIELDEYQGCYHFVEHSDDHTDRLIFSTTELDARALDRLLRSDSMSRIYQDPYDAAERAQDESLAERDARDSERLYAEGERLAHALRKDGMMPDFPLPVAIPRGVDNADSNG
jgi:hypothetical protein